MAGGGGSLLGGALGVAVPGQQIPIDPVIDFAVGLGDIVLRGLQRAIAGSGKSVAPLTRAGRRPLLRSAQLLARRIAPLLVPVQQRGRALRAQAEQDVLVLADALLPVVTDMILERIDVAAVIDKIDLDEVIRVSAGKVDVHALFDEVEVEAAIEMTMQRVDLTDIALQYMDMRRVLDAAMAEVDVAAVVRRQLEGVDLADLIRSTPTSIAGGALRQTSRLVRRG